MMEHEQKEGMLAPYRVLDLTDEKGFLCGKILGDLGAEVIKIEPPGGDESRNIGPFYKDIPDPEKSLYWFAYNNNKKGITLNIETATGREIFKKLAAGADFIIESFAPGYLEKLALDYAALKVINPGLVMTSITSFGQSGPYKDFKASDIELMALSGFMSLLGHPGEPPVRVSCPQSYVWTGMHAAMGTLIAHYYRITSGKGQHVDVSAQDSVLWALAHAPTFWDVNRTNVVREGAFVTGRSVTGAKMRCLYPCRDGYINFIVYGGAAGQKTNRALTEWMDSKGMATDYLKEKDWSKFDIASVTQSEIDLIEGPTAEFFKTLTKEEFLREAIERRMLGYPVSSAEDIIEDPQLKHRDFWARVEHPELGASIVYPGGFGKFSITFCGIKMRAPLIGEHNREIYEGKLGLTRAELVRLKEANVI